MLDPKAAVMKMLRDTKDKKEKNKLQDRRDDLYLTAHSSNLKKSCHFYLFAIVADNFPNMVAVVFIILIFINVFRQWLQIYLCSPCRRIAL